MPKDVPFTRRRGRRASLPCAQIVRAYASGTSTIALAREYGVDNVTVGRHLRRLGVQLRTLAETARLKRTMAGRDMDLRLGREDRERLTELVDGLMLGDGNMRANGSLELTQCKRRRGWPMQVAAELRALGCSCRLDSRGPRRCLIRGKRVKDRGSVRLLSLVYDDFAQQRRRWYPAGRKAVPVDVRLSTVAIAHWFAGDGCGPSSGDLVFCTNSFSRREVEQLAAGMPVPAKCKRVRPGQFVVHVSRMAHAVQLAAMIRPHLPACCLYKLRFVRRPTHRKLTDAQVRKVRALRDRGWTQPKIAKKFGMSVQSIWCLLAGRQYRDVA